MKETKKIQSKREREQYVVSQMIELYCKKQHKSKNGALCKDCQELKDYAWQRSEKCPFMETKTFCSNCKVHCYNPAMREKIREVMRFSGPRMLFFLPSDARNSTSDRIQVGKEKFRRFRLKSDISRAV